LLYPSLKGQAIFTVPTRALANDKLAEWRARGWDVGIATGDLALNLNAKVLVATLETQRPRFLRRDGPKLLVVDEYQMIADPVRGVHYELALALARLKPSCSSSAAASKIRTMSWRGFRGSGVILSSSLMTTGPFRWRKSICALCRIQRSFRQKVFGRG